MTSTLNAISYQITFKCFRNIICFVKPIFHMKNSVYVYAVFSLSIQFNGDFPLICCGKFSFKLVYTNTVLS